MFRFNFEICSSDNGYYLLKFNASLYAFDNVADLIDKLESMIKEVKIQ